jgi:hypothetical protein
MWGGAPQARQANANTGKDERMKKLSVFIAGLVFGIIIAVIATYINLEQLAATKQRIKNDNRKRGTPLFWLSRRWMGKLFFTPHEAALASKEDTRIQYPSKDELTQKPGPTNDEFYDKCFLNYIISRKLTDSEAWIEVQKDYPEKLPKNMGSEYTLLLRNTRKAFLEAMRRRRIGMTKTK